MHVETVSTSNSASARWTIGERRNVYTLPCCRQQGGLRAFKTIRPKLSIEFQGLGLTLNDGSVILSNVTGRWAKELCLYTRNWHERAWRHGAGASTTRL